MSEQLFFLLLPFTEKKTLGSKSVILSKNDEIIILLPYQYQTPSYFILCENWIMLHTYYHEKNNNLQHVQNSMPKY